MDTENARHTTEHDRGYKKVFAKKENFLHFLKKYIRADWAGEISESDLVSVNTSFVLKDYANREADVIYRARVKGREIIFYVLLELQSSVDHTMPFRLLIYITELLRAEFENAGKEERERAGYRLPAVVPMVLYNGADRWTAVRRFREYLDGYEMFGGNVIDFEYLLLDLNHSDEGFILNTNRLLDNVFALDRKDTLQEIAGVMQILLKRYVEMETHERVEFEDWVSEILVKRVKSKDSRESILGALKKGDIQTMTYGIDRAIEKERLEGELQYKIKVAEKMLKKEKDINEIIEISELPKEKILEIKKQFM